MQNSHSSSSSVVTEIRSASRDLVRELGFMNRTLAGTDLPPSSVHAILEIGAAGRLSSKALSEKLLLEKSTVSRLVKSLVAKRQLREVRSKDDARIKQLHLTPRGEKTLAAITRFAEQQVEAAIAPLNKQSRKLVMTGLKAYSAALRASREPSDAQPPDKPVVIERGYVPSLIGRIVEMHASTYSRLAGFGVAFETKVASGLAEFVARVQKPENAIWYAKKEGRIVGSIVIDGEDLGEARAHLRWFIVDGELRGAGLGKSLLREAIAFCDAQGFRETQLWTFKGLDAARRLYESHGFTLAEERPGDRWSREVLEQRFVRPLNAQTPRLAATNSTKL